MSSDSHKHISLKTYFVVFIALQLLLVVTVGAAYIEFGKFTLAVALAIASVKAFLIAYYFMHLKVSSRWVTMFFIGSLYTLITGMIIMFADYMWRY